MLPFSRVILLIDIGNTIIKWLFNGKYHQVLIDEFNLALLPNAEQTFVSCVGDRDLLAALDNVMFVESQSEFGSFQSGYQNPIDLGVDRFLAMIAALNHYPNQNLLVIDAGTALTFDLVLSSGQHQGGLIMPGLSKLRNSFNQFCTDSQQLTSQPLADSTKQAWEFGTGQMFIDGINIQIKRYLAKFANLNIVLTGGNGEALVLVLNYSMNYHQNLVLDGLFHYVKHQQYKY